MNTARTGDVLNFCVRPRHSSADENITNPSISFARVTSSPDPVVKHSNQTIEKMITYHGSVPILNVTARLELLHKD